jgi:hypothetical protein
MCQAVVGLVEGQGFGQGHQVGQAVGEDAGRGAAEPLLMQQALEADPAERQ